MDYILGVCATHSKRGLENGEKNSIICKLGVLKSSKMRMKQRDSPGLNRVFMVCAGTSLRLQ